jgi:protochlorophyllide reductase
MVLIIALKKLGNKSIDALALNAGIQTSTSGLGGKEKELKPKLTAQGHELTVGTNHVGHFLLMKLLMRNINSDNGRIVYVGSGVHNPDEGGGNVGSKATLGNLQGFKER